MLDAFSIGELSIALVSVLGALGLCLRGSKCSHIHTPCLHIDRELGDKVEYEEEEDNEDIDSKV